MRKGEWKMRTAALVAICLVAVAYAAGHAQTVTFSFVGEGFG